MEDAGNPVFDLCEFHFYSGNIPFFATDIKRIMGIFLKWKACKLLIFGKGRVGRPSTNALNEHCVRSTM